MKKKYYRIVVTDRFGTEETHLWPRVYGIRYDTFRDVLAAVGKEIRTRGCYTHPDANDLYDKASIDAQRVGFWQRSFDQRVYITDGERWWLTAEALPIDCVKYIEVAEGVELQ